MRRIGIRELRQNASQYIRLVKAGETIEVTERDVPVALLTPHTGMREKSRFDAMLDSGEIRRAVADHRALQPLPQRPGEPTLTTTLQELRDDERY